MRGASAAKRGTTNAILHHTDFSICIDDDGTLLFGILCYRRELDFGGP